MSPIPWYNLPSLDISLSRRKSKYFPDKKYFSTKNNWLSVAPRHKYKFNVQTLKWSRSNLTNNNRAFLFQLFPASQQTKRILLIKKVLKYFLSFLRLTPAVTAW